MHDLRIALLGASLSAATACQASSPPRQAGASEGQQPVVSAPVEAPAPSPAPAEAQAQPAAETPPADKPRFIGEGQLVIALQDRLLRLHTSGLHVVGGEGPAKILDLFEGPAGEVLVRGAEALYQLDGDELREQLRFEAAIMPVHQFAYAPDGTAWIVSDAGLGKREAERWSLTPLAELELDASARLAFDHEGTAWVVMLERALYREGRSWHATEVELMGPNLHFLNPTSSPVGRVHVNNRHRMTRIGKQDFDSVIMSFDQTIDYSADIALAVDGYGCVASAGCDIACANAIPPTIIWTYPGTRYACKQLEAIAVDAQHRVWVASRGRLSLLDPSQRKAREFELEQLDAPVLDMLIAGDGPAKP